MAKVAKETSEQTQAVKDRYEAISGIIKGYQDKIKGLKTEIGSYLDQIREVKRESAPLLAYLKVSGVVPRAKRAKKYKPPAE